MLNLALPSFQLYAKEREAKLQVDIDYLKETLKELCVCSQ